jgi:hypothetical protein
LAILAAVVWAQLRTWEMEKRPSQAIFASGSAKEPLVGRYKGEAGEYKGSWQGKVIQGEGRGANVFTRDGQESVEYPFAYYIGDAVRRKNLKVVVLDYNQPGNPWWLRFIRDEMVATGDATYLGKVHVWVLPHYYFTLGYFSLDYDANE